MDKNPANGIKDPTWNFLKDKSQEEDIPGLKAAVYRLIKMTTQKTAGQKGYSAKDNIPWETLNKEVMWIVIEATALVLSGRLDELIADESEADRDG